MQARTTAAPAPARPPARQGPTARGGSSWWRPMARSSFPESSVRGCGASTPPEDRPESARARQPRSASTAAASVRAGRTRTAGAPATPRRRRSAGCLRARWRRPIATAPPWPARVQRSRPNPASPVHLPVLAIGQIAVPTQQVFGVPYGAVEGQVLQPMDRVVVHEPLHGPELGHRLARLVDEAADAAAAQLVRGRGRHRKGFARHSAQGSPASVARVPVGAGRAACRAAVG